MNINAFGVTQFEVLNSITNSANDTKLDNVVPFTFMEFLKYAKSIQQDTVNIIQYNIYLKSWENITKDISTSGSTDIKTQFVNFLSEIKLKYSTLEEKRFLSNLDLTLNEDLEIAIPFFSRKIKEICLYFAKKKTLISQDTNIITSKGSSSSINDTIKTTIYDIFTGDDSNLPQTLNVTLTSIFDTLQIEVEATYDTFNDYYNIDPSQPPDFYNSIGDRSTYYTSNVNDISASYFQGSDEAIRALIKGKEINLKEVLPLLINVDSTDLSFFSNIDSIDYSQPTRTNLSYLTKIDLLKNYMGTDFFYISSNSFGVTVSGNLFDAAFPYRNLLNSEFASTLTIPNSDVLSERQVGLYFKPTSQGIIKMDSKFSYSINTDAISANSIYIFADPSKYVSNTPQLIFNVDDKSIYKNFSSRLGNNLPKITNNKQPFYSYSTKEQSSYTPKYDGQFTGISQFENTGDIYSKQTDIFGNTFICFTSDSYFYNNIRPVELVGGIPLQYSLPSTTTTTVTSYNAQLKQSISTKQFESKNYYTIDIQTLQSQPLSTSFSDIFLKFTYNSELYTQINTNIVDFVVFSDVFLLRTDNYVIIDKFIYNGKFASSGTIPVVNYYNKNNSIGSNISFISTPFKIKNDIYLTKIETQDSTNILKYFTLSIYKYNTSTNTLKLIIDKTTTSDSIYKDLFVFQNISSNMVTIRQSVLTHNSKTDTFLLTTNFIDLNFTPFIHVLTFKIKNGEVIVSFNKIFVPQNTATTSNFYNNAAANDWTTQSIRSTPTVNTTNGIFVL